MQSRTLQCGSTHCSVIQSLRSMVQRRRSMVRRQRTSNHIIGRAKATIWTGTRDPDLVIQHFKDKLALPPVARRQRAIVSSQSRQIRPLTVFLAVLTSRHGQATNILRRTGDIEVVIESTCGRRDPGEDDHRSRQAEHGDITMPPPPTAPLLPSSRHRGEDTGSHRTRSFGLEANWFVAIAGASANGP